MSAITIYSVPQVANLTVAGVNARMHMIIASTYSRSTLRIFRRAQNDLDFLVRDIDRQPVAVAGSLTMLVFDDVGNTVLSKALVIENEERGHYRLGITADETLTLKAGLYNWTVKSTDSGDVERLMYTNQDYATRGIVEVSEGLLVPLEEPYTVTTFTANNEFAYSEALPGANRVNNFSGNHSVVAHLVDFTGMIWVDTSLDSGTPTNDADWVETVARAFPEPTTGNIVIPFNGNYNFVRFRVSTIDGITKLVYRN